MYTRLSCTGRGRWALSILGLALLIGAQAPTLAQQIGEGPKVATWKTWHLASPDEIAVPAPPADTSDQTKAELNELRLLQAVRGPLLNRAAESWNGLAATKTWADIAIRLPFHPAAPEGRVIAYTHTAMLDAVVAAYRAKYTYNRKSPAQLATDLTPSFDTVAGEPSYPSEHAAIAGAAAAVLTYFVPAEAAKYDALAKEAAYSRLIAGTNYRSDVEAGLALGRAVAERAIARAKSDGSDKVSTEPFPTGAGIWGGKTTVGRMKGEQKPWLMTSNTQLRAVPPPAFGSAEFNAALGEVKRLATTVTASERVISDFWLTNGGYVPFYSTAYALMAQAKTSPARSARIIAHIATSTDDAVIACWESKFHYWLLRPIEADPTIPLLTPTPPYPDYTSGFSALAGSLSESVSYFFPQEATRLSKIAEQIAIMRVYQGIHFWFACEAGLKQGRQTAQLGAERDKANAN
jgi:hypothetical protein